MATRKRGLGRGLDALIQEQDTKASSRRKKDSDAEVSPQMVRISLVEPDRAQPRKTFDDEKLDELAGSIKNYGVVEPLIVQRVGDHYQIISGERRWRAAQRAGLKEVPIIVREFSEKEVAEISLIENIQREDLNPIEEAQAYQRLIAEYDYTQEEVAQRLSKNRSTITNALRLLKLTDAVQQMLIEKKISAGHARALIMVEDPQQQEEIAQRVAKEQLSVRDIEKLVKSYGKTARTKKDPNAAPAADYHALEERLKTSLGTKVSINAKANGRGRLEIEFYSNEDLEKIIDRIIMEE